MSTSSNSSFTGISNEIYGRINSGNVSSATVSAGTVKTGSLSCERLDYPGDFPLTSIIFLTGAGASVDLSASTTANDAIISNISNKGLLLLNSNGINTSPATIILGADTSARAAQLLSLFNISDAVPSRLIKVSLLTKNGAQIISIKNTTAAQVYVQYCDITGNTRNTVTNTMEIVGANATSDGYILVSKGSVVANSSTILFTVIGKAFA